MDTPHSTKYTALAPEHVDLKKSTKDAKAQKIVSEIPVRVAAYQIKRLV
jgi:hypothetical protein